MEDEVDPQARPSFQIPASVLYREVEKELVLLNLESEQYFGLNAVGATIVNLLTQEPLEKALTTLAGTYEVDPEVLRRDVETLIDRLIDAGLLERVDASG